MAKVVPQEGRAGKAIIPCLIHKSTKKHLLEEQPKLFVSELATIGKTGKLYLVGDADLDACIKELTAGNPSDLPKALVVYDHDNDFPSRVLASLRLLFPSGPNVPLVFLPSPDNAMSSGHLSGTHTYKEAVLSLKDGGEGELKNLDIQVLSDFQKPSNETTRCCLHSLGVGDISVRKSFGFFASLFASKQIGFEIQVDISDYDYDDMTHYTTLNEEQSRSHFGDFHSFTSFQSFKLNKHNPFSRRAFGVNTSAEDGHLDVVLITKATLSEVFTLVKSVPLLGDNTGTISGKWYSGESDVTYLKVKEFVLRFKPGDNNNVKFHINGILLHEPNKIFPGGIKVEVVPGALAVYTFRMERPRLMSKLK